MSVELPGKKLRCAAMLAAASIAIASQPAAAQIAKTYDVVVYGGTASGVIAAVAAAREGARVALLETGDHLGGLVSGGLGNADYGTKEVVGGYALEFYERAGRKYGVPVQWHVEPHVAETIFREMALEAGVSVFYRHRLRERAGVKKAGTQVIAITTENDTVFAGRVFIDATYEGDLLALAGVSHTWGREGRYAYGEELAGVQPPTPFDQFKVRLPGRDPQGRKWPEVSALPKAPLGSADKKVQAYNFRMCLTQVPQNRLPFPKPRGYNSRRYALLAAMLAAMDQTKRTIDRGAGVNASPWNIAELFGPNVLPNGKTDTNGRGAFSTDYIGGNYAYPNGDYRTRARVWRAHVEYQQGLMYFLQHDPQVPRALRDIMGTWGLCKDEFIDNAHWPHQLYVREARRMVGDFVMTQRDAQTETNKRDAIGMGSFALDSHNVQRIVNESGYVENEGGFFVNIAPYQIPYRVLLPKRLEATNLLVPICVSASHVAYGTLRVEPVYMVMGHAAGLAAKWAIDRDVAVQDVDTQDLVAKLRAQRVVIEWEPTAKK